MPNNVFVCHLSMKKTYVFIVFVIPWSSRRSHEVISILNNGPYYMFCITKSALSSPTLTVLSGDVCIIAPWATCSLAGLIFSSGTKYPRLLALLLDVSQLIVVLHALPVSIHALPRLGVCILPSLPSGQTLVDYSLRNK